MSGRLPTIAVVSTPALSGCAVVTVAGAAASAGATVFGAAADVGPGAVKVAGKAIGNSVTVVSGPGNTLPAPTDEPKRQQ